MAEPVQLPDQDRVNRPRVRILEHSVEFRPARLRTTYTEVDVFARDRPAAALGVLPELAELHVRVRPFGVLTRA